MDSSILDDCELVITNDELLIIFKTKMPLDDQLTLSNQRHS